MSDYEELRKLTGSARSVPCTPSIIIATLERICQTLNSTRLDTVSSAESEMCHHLFRSFCPVAPTGMIYWPKVFVPKGLKTNAGKITNF